MGHFKDVCVGCGTVTQQCRCPDPNKQVNDTVCPDCKSKGVTLHDGNKATSGDFPRRARMDKWCPAERAIGTAMEAVEAMQADTRLTEAVVLLGEARAHVADFIDGEPQRPTLGDLRTALAQARSDLKAIPGTLPNGDCAPGQWVWAEWCSVANTIRMIDKLIGPERTTASPLPRKTN